MNAEPFLTKVAVMNESLKVKTLILNYLLNMPKQDKSNLAQLSQIKQSSISKTYHKEES